MRTLTLLLALLLLSGCGSKPLEVKNADGTPFVAGSQATTTTTTAAVRVNRPTTTSATPSADYCAKVAPMVVLGTTPANETDAAKRERYRQIAVRSAEIVAVAPAGAKPYWTAFQRAAEATSKGGVATKEDLKAIIDGTDAMADSLESCGPDTLKYVNG